GRWLAHLLAAFQLGFGQFFHRGLARHCRGFARRRKARCPLAAPSSCPDATRRAPCLGLRTVRYRLQARAGLPVAASRSPLHLAWQARRKAPVRQGSRLLPPLASERSSGPFRPQRVEAWKLRFPLADASRYRRASDEHLTDGQPTSDKV